MASGDETKSWLRGRLDWIALAGVAIAGWLVVLVVNRWHIGAPVVFLCLGWLAVLLCGRTLWGSAQAAAGEGTGPDEAGFELSAGRVAELEKEKRALLKAIKEVEFDREMGKMSEHDAAEISRVYRARAIDILKELEGDDGALSARNAPIGLVIESEVRARLALAGVATRAKDKAQARAARSGAAPAETGTADAASAAGAADATGAVGTAAATSAAGAAEATDTGASSGAGASEGGESSGEDRAGEAPREASLDASAAAAEVAEADVGAAGAATSASASTGAPSPNKKKTKAKAKSPRASDGSGGVAGSGSGGAGGAAMQKREDA